LGGRLMGILDRFRRRGGRPGSRGARPEDVEHLFNWAASRRGAEGYLEPRPYVTEPTLLLIAHDGESTRRRADAPAAASRGAAPGGRPGCRVPHRAPDADPLLRSAQGRLSAADAGLPGATAHPAQAGAAASPAGRQRDQRRGLNPQFATRVVGLQCTGNATELA